MLIDDAKTRKDTFVEQKELREQILTALRESLRIAVEKRRFFQKPPHRNLKREREWAKLVDMISSQIRSVLEAEDSHG